MLREACIIRMRMQKTKDTTDDGQRGQKGLAKGKGFTQGSKQIEAQGDYNPRVVGEMEMLRQVQLSSFTRSDHD